jgi:hypothetical protein
MRRTIYLPTNFEIETLALVARAMVVPTVQPLHTLYN